MSIGGRVWCVECVGGWWQSVLPLWDHKTGSITAYAALVFVHLTQTESPGKKESKFRKYLQQIGLWGWIWEVFPITDCGRAQPTVNSATNDWMVLDYIRKQTEPTMGNKAVNRVSSCSLIQFLNLVFFFFFSGDPALASLNGLLPVNLMNLFTFQLAFGQCFITVTEK